MENIPGNTPSPIKLLSNQVHLRTFPPGKQAPITRGCFPHRQWERVNCFSQVLREVCPPPVPITGFPEMEHVPGASPLITSWQMGPWAQISSSLHLLEAFSTWSRESGAASPLTSRQRSDRHLSQRAGRLGSIRDHRGADFHTSSWPRLLF